MLYYSQGMDNVTIVRAYVHTCMHNVYFFVVKIVILISLYYFVFQMEKKTLEEIIIFEFHFHFLSTQFGPVSNNCN